MRLPVPLRASVLAAGLVSVLVALGISACSGGSDATTSSDEGGASVDGATTTKPSDEVDGGNEGGREGGPVSPPSVVLFGGLSTESAGSSAVYASDTWAWDGKAWRGLGVPGPAGRAGAAIAAIGGKLVLFGGYSLQGRLTDTWSWDGASWLPLSVTGPSNLGESAMAALGGKIVLFDGLGTWLFDGGAWTKLGVTSPSPRDRAGMATYQGKAVLHGGHVHDATRGDLCLQDTWTWDGSTWTLAAAGGPP
ncbi:MAG TPA: kelch repeat-containing protein, partial [Labilithrix sp.]|nr:kelch repeat-containing protein [Labilithrix sp.]